MTLISKRYLLRGGTALVALGRGAAWAQATGFGTASEEMGGPDAGPATPGLQGVTALCEVTGGGEKVYGVAIRYDVVIEPLSLGPDSFTTGVVPAAKGYFPGMPEAASKDSAEAPAPRAPKAIYTNATAALRADQSSAPGAFVILEFHHDPDLSLPTTDSDLVQVTQLRAVKTTSGAEYGP